jgi:NAD(P)-dependent dehydrogenase (short-subunit alcohol dehydrogenase family)
VPKPSPVPDASYSSSEGALIRLTRELDCQWAPSGIRVNALGPRLLPTEAAAAMIDDEASQRHLRRGCPMQRRGHTHELDGAILLFASSASTYMTGQVLTVDGGWTAH